ncbi:MAG: hypothetical protein Kow00108_10340 [Calditrichia bacterium]
MKQIKTMLILLIMAGLALAQPGQKSHPGKEGRFMQEKMGKQMKHHGKHLMKHLDLTEEQSEKLQQMRTDLEKKLLPMESKLVALKNELVLLKTEDSPNIDKIEKKIDEISEVKSEMQKLRERHFVEMKKMLTDEQKEKLNMMIMKKSKMKKHRR